MSRFVHYKFHVKIFKDPLNNSFLPSKFRKLHKNYEYDRNQISFK